MRNNHIRTQSLDIRRLYKAMGELRSVQPPWIIGRPPRVVRQEASLRRNHCAVFRHRAQLLRKALRFAKLHIPKGTKLTIERHCNQKQPSTEAETQQHPARPERRLFPAD